MKDVTVTLLNSYRSIRNSGLEFGRSQFCLSVIVVYVRGSLGIPGGGQW